MWLWVLFAALAGYAAGISTTPLEFVLAQAVIVVALAQATEV